jgi:uncharacterized membrane protein YcaP (DUF421 family)
MMETLNQAFGVGVEAQNLTTTQVALRAIVVFFASLSIARIAAKRFFAKKTAFDVILAFILASMLARAINGSEPLIPTIASGFLLALLHRMLGWAARRWPALGNAIKGHTELIIEDGKVHEATLHRHDMADDDLAEELRLAGAESPQEVLRARLERSGEISVIKQRPKRSNRLAIEPK